MGKTKITVKIVETLLKAFDQEVNSVFFKRDAFLNHIIRGEARHLSDELCGKKQSSAARVYIAGELKRLGTKPVNVVVDKETATKLNDIVRKSNIVRDAFLNRLILFLLSRDSLLEYLELPLEFDQSEYKSVLDGLPTSPLGAIGSICADPLFYLRVAADERHHCGLYLLGLPTKLMGLSCFLEDSQVPRTDDFEKDRLVSLDDL